MEREIEKRKGKKILILKINILIIKEIKRFKSNINLIIFIISFYNLIIFYPIPFFNLNFQK